jgi:hypothetical protein
MKTTILFLCLFFFSCGYFEDDGDLFEKNITGKIILVHQKHAEWPNLSFQDSEQSRSIENCKSITYDTINQRLFVEEFLNPHNSSFYQISVLDANALNITKAYKMYELEEKRFRYLVKECNACKVIDMTGE